MATWFWYAIAAAILYGLHQVFTKLAANYISDGLGGLVVEATATVTIAIYLVFLWLTNTWTQKATSIGIDRKSTRLNSSHIQKSRMPSSA